MRDLGTEAMMQGHQQEEANKLSRRDAKCEQQAATYQPAPKVYHSPDMLPNNRVTQRLSKDEEIKAQTRYSSFYMSLHTGCQQVQKPIQEETHVRMGDHTAWKYHVRGGPRSPTSRMVHYGRKAPSLPCYTSEQLQDEDTKDISISCRVLQTLATFGISVEARDSFQPAQRFSRRRHYSSVISR